jgi:hypothetical protein
MSMAAVAQRPNSAHVAELITSTLALARFPDHPVPDGDLDLMRTFAIVKVPSGADFSYDGADADFRLRKDLDRLNFSELEPGATPASSPARPHSTVTAGQIFARAADCTPTGCSKYTTVRPNSRARWRCASSKLLTQA